MLISRTTIDDVHAKADLLTVIQRSGVVLKKAGGSWKGCCPFHDEKTPSFVVTPARNMYKCFGCGEGGNNAVSYVMDAQRMTYPDAIRHLADMFGILVEEEQETPEHKEKRAAREQVLTFYRRAQATYVKALVDAPEDSPEGKYIRSRFTPEQIDQWGIGLAPEGWQFLTNKALEQQYKREFLVQTGLIRESEKKEAKLYDFFRQRMMIPVHNARGQVIAYTARVFPHADTDQKGNKLGKWVNSVASDIFQKDRTLFGLYQAREAIEKQGGVIIVEGAGDVIHMHHVGMANTVAGMGTSVTEHHLETLRNITGKVTFFMDGDAAGAKALKRAAAIALEQGFDVKFAQLPSRKDPEDFFAPETDKEGIASSRWPYDWFHKNEEDYVLHRASVEFANIGKDPMKKNDALIAIADLLHLMDDEKRTLYIKQIVADNKAITQSDLKTKLEQLDKVEPEKEKRLPEGVDANEAEDWGFFESKNSLHFKNEQDTWKKMSNFAMKPIFHVISLTDSRRVYELTNYRGAKVTVDLDMQEMTSVQAFKRHIEGRGNFLWWGMDQHMNKLKLWLYENTKTCYEIAVLGWQKEGFYAWANGITTTSGEFHPVDMYGRVSHGDKNYYIPAFSSIYLDDKSMFQAERKFKFEEGTVTLQQWLDLFLKCYGDNGRIAFCWWVATVFRDHIFRLFNNYPILNFFGPKGTGKNQLAYSISYLHGDFQTPFNIHNGTLPGFSDHMQQFCNAPAIVDEYKNSLDYVKIETLKSSHDGIGRTRMKVDRGMKKETTSVNAGVILMGQEMPTADIALFSRTIHCAFHKTTFNTAEKKLFGKLEDMQKKGLSHLTAHLIQYRKHFEDNFYKEHQRALADLAKVEGTQIVEDRMIRHYATLLASYRTLAMVEEMPLDDKNMVAVLAANMIGQAQQMSRSDELGIFWNIIEGLFDQDMIIADWDFKIRTMTEITVKGSDEPKKFGEPKEVLQMKFNSVSAAYKKQAKQIGENVLPQDTLRYYLENRPEFLGVAKCVKFTLSTRDPGTGEPLRKSQPTTAYSFDYKMLGVNLHRDDGWGDGSAGSNGQANGKPTPVNGSPTPRPDIFTESVKEEDVAPF
jgi:DNA primase catalytic core